GGRASANEASVWTEDFEWEARIRRLPCKSAPVRIAEERLRARRSHDPSCNRARNFGGVGDRNRRGARTPRGLPHAAGQNRRPVPGGRADQHPRGRHRARLSEIWGQPMVVENQPGANTAIAAARVAKTPADGYTLLAAMDVILVLNPLATSNLSYDPLKDFAPITLASKNTSLLSVRAEDGPKTVKELIARAKTNPGKLNY